ncbi:MAG TPA: CYTH domain-containing protein [Candidatus Limnocylindria bacterium]|nr:CYTH domain-containing protein [Candidatus Limnocylindria bacterium]
MSAAVLEVEIKLRAEEAALVELASASSLGPAWFCAPRTVDETDLYLDTDDGRLAAARWACRVRSREGRRWIALKGPAREPTADAVHRRPELEGDAPEGDAMEPMAWPPSPARDLVTRLAGAAPLAERLSLHQRRTERDVLVGERRVGTLSLDVARVVRGGAELGTLRVVELELVPPVAEDLLRELRAALLARAGLEPEPASKLERALELSEGAGRTVA